AEEEKHVRNADVVLFQMRLGCARLPEGPASIQEHRVVVAEIAGTNPPFGYLLDDVSEPYNMVARLGASLRRDGKANRLPTNDRRRSLPGSTIKALSAENHLHGRS